MNLSIDFFEFFLDLILKKLNVAGPSYYEYFPSGSKPALSLSKGGGASALRSCTATEDGRPLHGLIKQ
jgi:hypothetical protein